MTYICLLDFSYTKGNLYQIILIILKMWNASSFKTPTKKQSQPMINTRIISEQSAQPQLKNSRIFKQLYEKFFNISNTIDVDLTKINFNLIAYEKKDQKIKYDPQMVIAKLKQLQNKAEMNRAEMQLSARRKKNKNSVSRRQKNQFQQLSYNETFKIYKTNSKLLELPIEDSQSDAQIQQKPHKGITRFHQLRKHSKILEYTMQKIKQKQQQVKKQKIFVSERKLQVKNQTSSFANMGSQYEEYLLKNKKDILHHNQKIECKKNNKNINQNPQKIVQDRYKRILTMKAKDKISDQVKKNPRCNYMISRQNQIILDLENESKSLSKQNLKKLKSRFAQIVNQIHKGDRKRKQAILPNLTAR